MSAANVSRRPLCALRFRPGLAPTLGLRPRGFASAGSRILPGLPSARARSARALERASRPSGEAPATTPLWASRTSPRLKFTVLGHSSDALQGPSGFALGLRAPAARNPLRRARRLLRKHPSARMEHPTYIFIQYIFNVLNGHLRWHLELSPYARARSARAAPGERRGRGDVPPGQ
jgi:hypothetical protein